MAAQVSDSQTHALLQTTNSWLSQSVKLLSDISLTLHDQTALLHQIIAILNPVGKRATFELQGENMATQTGTTFSIPDSAPKTGYSIMAGLLDAGGNAATFTSPAFGAVSDPQSVLANFASADQITGTFDITGTLGSAQIPWSATNSEGTSVAGTATISVTSGAGVSVSFTLTTP